MNDNQHDAEDHGIGDDDVGRTSPIDIIEMTCAA